MAESVEQILDNYSTISVEEMKTVGLMNRTDTKFVTSRERLARLLRLAEADYLVQESDNNRIYHYSTIYFDTPHCDMYRRHQNGKANRQKLRLRFYKEWGANFLEIKTKDNHARTDKKRIRVRPSQFFGNNGTSVASAVAEQHKACEDFVREHLRYDVGCLSERIENQFRRITLVNKSRTERLTIDLDVSFHNLETDRRLTLSNVAVIELKRDGRVPSPILALLKQLRIKPMGFSKYCIGMALTNPDLPRNRIKERLRNINKLENNN